MENNRLNNVKHDGGGSEMFLLVNNRSIPDSEGVEPWLGNHHMKDL